MNLIRVFIIVTSVLLSFSHSVLATGDCDSNGIVNISEVQTAINMFLGLNSPATCVDEDLNGSVSISEVQKTINSFLGLIPAGPTYSIIGTVSLGGSGLSGVTMALSGAGSTSSSTDASGNYIFSGLTNGSYIITPSKSDFSFSPISSTLNVNGANISPVNFTATQTQSAKVVPCPLSVTTNIAIQNFSFAPSPVTVSTNDIVKWTNNDPFTHTVTSGSAPNIDGKFNSGNLGVGATVCVQFLAVGSFTYFCSIHSFMVGSVIVQ